MRLLWTLTCILIACSSHATQFAVSPDTIILDDEGIGILTLINPGNTPLHYAIDGTEDSVSGYLLAQESEEVFLTPTSESIQIQFDDGAGLGVMEIEIAVVRPGAFDYRTLLLGVFLLLALFLAAKIYIVR